MDCEDRESFLERCPSPYVSPEELAASREEIAQIKWCDLDRVRRALVLQKALLGKSDEEIAAENGQTPSWVKNTYQNARTKVREKLRGACPARTGWSDLLDGL